MNYWEYFKSTTGNRDFVFQDILSEFNGRPLQICEIGCARNKDLRARKGDGWSSFHFLDYIMRHGGALDIVDIDPTNLANCRVLLESYFPDPTDIIYRLGFYCRDGESYLHYIKPFVKPYDLVFLDGGDDPKQTLAQFCELNRGEKVLIDDFHSKGILMSAVYPDYRCYRWTALPWDKAPEMAAYGFGSGLIKCKHLE